VISTKLVKTLVLSHLNDQTIKDKLDCVLAFPQGKLGLVLKLGGGQISFVDLEIDICVYGFVRYELFGCGV